MADVRVSDEELARALEAQTDADGTDRRLISAAARMTPAERARSEANARALAAALRATMKPKARRDTSDL
jgi:hypothetical protein